ncbi:MAG: FAD:protein FMN transferase [Lachnospiraceae bacterium]|nr:FAD:protein FMN transferase [Lachnospiraceae bacterium]
MKRLLSLLLAVSLIAGGCSSLPAAPQQKQYTATFLSLFDTVTTIVGKADSEEAFQAEAQAVRDELQVYHQLFDIYHDYDGMNNLKTVNDQAGVAPVKVDERIIRMLTDAKAFYEITDGRVNVAMGSVLNLWHEARSDGRDDPVNARIPGDDELKAAAEHVSIDMLVIDENASTVYLSDPEVRLDVGAIAKGWAVQQVAKSAPKGLLISVGGNVCATGPKDDKGTPWVIGVQDPDGGNDYLHTIYVSGGSVVTSGDYQRTYVVDGKAYHHIIDPDTLYPSDYWRAVTVVCEDSGVADALSTALFLLSQEEGQKLLDLYGAEGLWVADDGSIHYSPGFNDLIRT